MSYNGSFTEAKVTRFPYSVSDSDGLVVDAVFAIPDSSDKSQDTPVLPNPAEACTHP